MTPFARIVSGRRSKFVVLAAWIVALVALGPLIGQFESKQRNEPSSFLPEDAESVRALELSDQFPSAEGVAAIAIFSRAGGLTDADREAIAGIQAELDESRPDGVVSVSPPQLSEDGEAALVVTQIVADGDEEILIDAVDAIRDELARGSGRASTRKSRGRPGTRPTRAPPSRASTRRSSSRPRCSSSCSSSSSIAARSSGRSRCSPSSSPRASCAGSDRCSSTQASSSTARPGGILLVLVFGAGTDYALLLTARYREELHRHEDKHEAMRIAVRQAGPGILASAGTVVAALLCLSLASVNSTAGLGPVGAMGVAVAAMAMLTVLPALLLIGGRRAFWPFVPRFDRPEAENGHVVARRRSGDGSARGSSAGTARSGSSRRSALLALALGTLTLDSNLTTANAFRGEIEAVEGQKLLERSFPAGASAPTTVIVTDQEQLDAVLAAAGEAPAGRQRRTRRDRRAGRALHRDSHRGSVQPGGLRADRATARRSCERPAATPFWSAAPPPRSSTSARPCAATRSSSSRSCSSSSS